MVQQESNTVVRTSDLSDDLYLPELQAENVLKKQRRPWRDVIHPFKARAAVGADDWLNDASSRSHGIARLRCGKALGERHSALKGSSIAWPYAVGLQRLCLVDNHRARMRAQCAFARRSLKVYALCA